MLADHSKVYDEATQKVMNDRVLKNYGKFMQEYSEKMVQMERNFCSHTFEIQDSYIDTVYVNFSPLENCLFEEMIICGEKNVQKSLIFLSYLSKEVHDVVSDATNKFFPGLLFYGEGEECKGNNDGDNQLCIGRMASFFQNLLMFINHCNEVLTNLMKQICGIYCSDPRDRVFDLSELHFGSVFDLVFEVLKIMMSFDSIVSHNQVLIEDWKQYEKMLKSVESDPSCIGVTPDKIVQLEQVLCQFDEKMFSCNILKESMELSSKMCENIKSNVLHEELSQYIRSRLSEVETKILEECYLDAHDVIVKLCCAFVFSQQLFVESDKKLFKQLWELCKKLPAIPLFGNTMFYPDKFLDEYIPKVVNLVERKPFQAMSNLRLDYLNRKSSNITKDVQLYSSWLYSWLLNIENLRFQDDVELKPEDMNKECRLLVQGLVYAGYIGFQVQSLLNMYVSLSKPMSKSTVVSVCALLELMKVIYNTYHSQGVFIFQRVSHVVQHLKIVLHTKIQIAMKRLDADKKPTEKNVFVKYCLDLFRQLISGPPTASRKYVIDHLLCFCNQSKILRDDMTQISRTLGQLWSISQLGKDIERRCDCSFLYWHRVIFPIYIKHIYNNPVDIHRLQYVVDAAGDCLKPMGHVTHLSGPNCLRESFKKEVIVYLKEQLLEPLCKDVETELRLNVHSHLKPQDRNPFQILSKDKYWALTKTSLKVFDQLLSIKGYVENYLQKTYYNLTTVALHDWKSYQEMANLAQYQYGLETVKSNLPSQTLEQGLDVLEIMRNIHIFVSRYFYNLNAQVFIEKGSKSKHLNTISIRHIANSMRTHGTGIRNTAVNFTYQFLRKKFFVFSQFLYDDHIKSKLLRDLRYFKQTRDAYEPRFPYERAQKFNKDIRRLGVSRDGMTFLDQFRILITEIGNAMGYVRMVRSGSLHSCSDCITFIPNLNDVVNFEEMCKEENLSPECQEAAKHLDLVIAELTNHFTHETEYFRLLVAVFGNVVNSPKNSHLKNFFVIVPALTINFVEHIVNTKERMNKKNKENASFTDDGFAMGVAYILKLLNLNDEFDSLNWFKEVEEKYAKEKTKIQHEKQNLGTPRGDEKLSQTHSLTIKRLETYLKEFQLFNYCFSSARIFFYFDTSDKAESETSSNVNSTGDEHTPND